MASIKTTRLGGTASNVEIYKIGLGLMMMTWTPNPTPDEQAFETIKTAIDIVPEGKKLFINSGEFYGVEPRTANLELIARFFTKYPELADRVFLSVKGGTEAESLTPDGSPENIRRSVDAILSALDGKKKLDLFQCARVDSRVGVESQMKSMVTLVKEGKFDHIGISEVSAETVKKANAIHQVAAVEIEVSPWSYEGETKKVIATCEELGITVIAYSPLGRGFLTGKLNPKDLPEGDFRKHLDKFQDEAAKHNQKIVDQLTAIAEKKNATSAQLSLAWVTSLGNVVPIPGSSKAARVKENFGSADILLTPEDLKAIHGVLEENPVQGGRYNKAMGNQLWG
ncbi:hypothetical protein FRB96_003231 [Tulasnella sp. 330]|nr:hypothetical protein FRB96_003231 [Tulasnella sp. 330]KAG8874914.1 hypothetical protein FRB97_005546 [Tulasnella sp. 331]KAG8879882.1 hypothetical protein FRB98_005471 [Tulasnella sp. 332]